MSLSSAASRVAVDIARLCASGFDGEELRRRVMHRLAAAVPFDAYCCGTIDPLTMLITSEVAEGIPAGAFPISAENEYGETDVSKFCVLARGAQRSAVLSQATAGSPASSPRFRRLIEPFGFGPELRSAFVDRGICWGGVTLLRYRNQPDFTQADARFLTRLSPHIAAGLRAAMVREGRIPGPAASPGILILDERFQVEALTREAEGWLDELPGVGSAELPRAVYEVASRVRALATGNDPGRPARLRVCTRSGQWLVLHGSLLAGARHPLPRTAIVIETARPPEVAPLIMHAYGFSPREQEVLDQVLGGASTAETARTLAISAYTVGDYLKAIFARVGVHSQRELIAHFLGDPSITEPTQAAQPYGDATRRLALGQMPG